MKPDKIARKVWMVASLAVLLIVAGFWFSTDSNATILGKYSTQTTLKLGLVTVVGYLSILLLRFLLLPQEVLLNGKQRVISLRTKFLVTFALFLLGLVVTEGMLQCKHQSSLKKDFAQRQKKITGFDPFLQVVPMPNDKSLNINRWGFRGEEIDKIKPPETYRIFVVGGSTVYCSRVSFELSHARVLEKQLRKRYTGFKIEVQNAGMHWHSSQHSLIKILFKIQDFNPDMIIIYHSINDLYRSFSPKEFALGPYRNDYSHYLGPIAPIVQEYFSEQTGFKMLTLETILNFFRYSWFTDFRDLSSLESTSNLPEVSVNNWPSSIAFERNMKNLVTLVKTLNIDLVMASQPYLYRLDLSKVEREEIWFPATVGHIGDSQVDISSVIKGMEAFNDISKRIAASNEVLFVDLEGAVPKSLDYFLDDVHYTEEGNRIIGQYFADQIIENGYITRKFPEITEVPPITRRNF